MQIGDLVMFKATRKMGIIKAVGCFEALILWNDGVTCWIAVWGLEEICK